MAQTALIHILSILKVDDMDAGDWIGLAGLAISVIGFSVGIWQLIRTARAAQAAKDAIERTEARLALNHLLVLLPQFRLIENDLDSAAQDDDRPLARRSLVAFAHFAAEVASILQNQAKINQSLVLDLQASATQASRAKASLIDIPGKTTKTLTKEIREQISALSVHIGSLSANYQMSTSNADGGKNA
jgi:hypothetical protein